MDTKAPQDAASAPLASSTSLLMLQMMRAAWRLRAVAFGPLSPRALESNGTTTANVGLSTDCTNVVAASAWTVASTSFGLEADDTSFGMTGSTSRLPLKPKAAVTAALACVDRCRHAWTLVWS